VALLPIPYVVSGIYITTGNGQVCLNWSIVSGATSYSVQRSTDGVTYSALATVSSNLYVDTTAVIGTQYYYQVASTNSTGTSPYTSIGTNDLPLKITPCAPGQVNLGYLRYQSRLRADMLMSQFLTDDEWNIMLNQSITELYDILVAKFGEDYFLAPLQVFSTNGSQFYPLPDGTNYKNTNGIPDPAGSPAAACYKVYGLDLNSYGANLSNATGWISMSRFNIADRNKYNLFLGAASNNVAGQYAQFQYREMGTNLEVLPINSGQYLRLWYVPISKQLLLDTDMLPFSYSGWSEYVVVDVAAKALAKQEFFAQAAELLARKKELEVRIETTASNRDVGQPNTATNSRSMLGDPNFGGGMFGTGRWGNGGW
jgi:hypothetical protein